jgi:hypothetical protein
VLLPLLLLLLYRFWARVSRKLHLTKEHVGELGICQLCEWADEHLVTQLCRAAALMLPN